MIRSSEPKGVTWALVAALLLVCDPAGAAPPRYEPRILDSSRLGVAEGQFFNSGFCCFLNNESQLVGTLFRDGFADVYVWDTRTDTIEFLPVVNTVASPPRLNGAGHLIGQLPGTLDGYFWSPEAGVVELLEPPFTLAWGRAINEASQVLLFRREPGGFVDQMLLWDPSGTVIPIDPGLGGEVEADAGGLNDLGQVVGVGSEIGAFFWDPILGFSAPALAPGSAFVEPVAVNDAGQIAGYFYVEDANPFIGFRRFGAFWESPDAIPTELPCEPATPGLCDMLEVTERGQVFGQAAEDSFFEFAGIVWTEAIPSLVIDRIEPPPGYDVDACAGSDINDLGEVSGAGALVPTGDPESAIAGPCILVPIPTVQIESPTPGAGVDATELLVTGFATDEYEIASVFVNGVEAALTDANDPDDPIKVAFEATIPLAAGANEIVAVATDVDRNTDEDAVTVTNEGSAGGEPRLCDVNGDDVVDHVDVDAIFAARESEPDGPDDPRDANGDGVISINDARLCVLECDLPACATPPPEPACGLVGLELLLPVALGIRRRRPRSQGEARCHPSTS